MTPLLYLGALLVAFGCMLALDWRFRLFWFRSPRHAAVVTAVGVVALLLADAAGIASGVFLRGDGAIATGIVIAPHLPVEEPIFLLFLVQCTMVVFALAERLRERSRT